MTVEDHFSGIADAAPRDARGRVAVQTCRTRPVAVAATLLAPASMAPRARE
jgi:hypothetical protein